MALTLRSSAFETGARIPTRHTCEGENVSPPLSWSGQPAETESQVLIVDDPDAPNGTWSHWALYDIPADVNELSAALTGETIPEGAAQGRNDFGNVKYEGPCPPPGEEHRYFFRLYALDTHLNLAPGATRAQVLDHMQDHILTHTELVGVYERS
jgi:hypothetical protein